MEYRVIEVGLLGVNCAIVFGSAGVVVIDPGGDCESIVRTVGERNLEAILLTHCHYDHIGAVQELLEQFPACELYCHVDCAKGLKNPMMNLSALITGAAYNINKEPVLVSGHEKLGLVNEEITVFHVPGHSPGQLCYYFAEDGVVFCGDTIFAGGIGRSDLPGGDEELLRVKCRKMLEALPASTVLIPGHGPQTSAGKELMSNPFL